MTEEWREVAGYEGAYEVSNLGRVRSLPGGQRHGIVLKPGHSGRGYLSVSLCIAGVPRTFYIHHLVARAFIGPRPEGLDVCHSDGDFLDNRPQNLRYDTANGNMRDSIAQGTHRSTQRTHCDHDHELTEANTYRLTTRSSDGGTKTRSRCRICLTLTNAKTYQRSRARSVAA